MNVSVFKQTLLQKINKKKAIDCPDPDYLKIKRQVDIYEKATSKYNKVLKSWARKSETASKFQHELGEIIMEASESESDSRTKELLTRMGDCLVSVSDVQHSMLVRSVESIIFPFQQFQNDAKELSIFHRYWLKTLAVYKAQLETCQKVQKTVNAEKIEQSAQELVQKASEMDEALHDARQVAYKLKTQLETDNSMILMFDLLYNYFKTGLEYTQDVMPIVEEYKAKVAEKAKNIKPVTKITTPIDAPPPRNISTGNGPSEKEKPTQRNTSPPTPISLNINILDNNEGKVSKRDQKTPSQNNNISSVKEVIREQPPTPKEKVTEPIGWAYSAYAYTAGELSEISFSEGELIIVYKKDTSSWGLGRTKDNPQIGEFPWNYITDYSDVGKVVAEYDYKAQDNDELTFSEGDEITLFLQEGDWWYGMLNGQIGIFPQNYVRKL